MKLFILSFFVSSLVFAHDYQLQKADATYTVSHLVKKVDGVSKDLKGKMVCDKGECDYLIAIPVKSFISSDSNRDLNMLTILEAGRYPLITVRGRFPETKLAQPQFALDASVDFHGIKKDYKLNLNKNGDTIKGDFVLLLEAHKVERPSLLTVKIENEVPIKFNILWR